MKTLQTGSGKILYHMYKGKFTFSARFTYGKKSILKGPTSFTGNILF